MERAPNTYSPEEVRRAIQRMRTETDTLDGAIATINTTISDLQSDVSAIDGRVTALEAADTAEAQAVENIGIGSPVYGVSGLPQAGLARADTLAKWRVAGLALNAAEAGFTVTFRTDGNIELADWSAVAGTPLLTPNAVYYLGESGGLTPTAPTAGGRAVTEVGRAVEETILCLSIRRPIRL